MAKKRKKAALFKQETNITYNKYKPNRKARRLGIKPKEPPEKEQRAVSQAAAVWECIQRAKAVQKRIVPRGKTYGEYQDYLKEKWRQLFEKNRSV